MTIDVFREAYARGREQIKPSDAKIISIRTEARERYKTELADFFAKLASRIEAAAAKDETILKVLEVDLKDIDIIHKEKPIRLHGFHAKLKYGSPADLIYLELRQIGLDAKLNYAWKKRFFGLTLGHPLRFWLWIDLTKLSSMESVS
jgi:hypothetical protein